jgi:spore coat polysaccharide biosynthesis predicted glycosyltransferase SpsG
VIFDDDGTDPINADIALNGSPAQLAKIYSNQDRCRYLVGPRYFLMDSRYKKVIVSPPRGSVRDVFITVGGSDHHDLLFKLIRVFNEFGDRYRVKIASTTATGYSERLRTVLKDVRFFFELYVDLPSLLRLWETSDVAITAGGNTLFERIATRLPGATLCQLELQMKHAESFERLCVNKNLGYGPDLDVRSLFAKLERFLNDTDEHKLQYSRSSDLVTAEGLECFIQEVGKIHKFI